MDIRLYLEMCDNENIAYQISDNITKAIITAKFISLN